MPLAIQKVALALYAEGAIGVCTGCGGLESVIIFRVPAASVLVPQKGAPSMSGGRHWRGACDRPRVDDRGPLMVCSP